MLAFYLVPIEIIINPNGGDWRGPKYFDWRFDPDPPGIVCHWYPIDYGFIPYTLILATDISQSDHDSLVTHSDVFVFPSNLDLPVDQDIQAFFEAIYLPTDWLTPSTTWRELLRMTVGMMKFNLRYSGIYAVRYGGYHSIFDNADLSTRLRQLTAQEQEIFLATAESYGINPSIIDLNSQLRLLVRQAGSLWVNISFRLGGYEF